jgi:hypothetical protein
LAPKKEKKTTQLIYVDWILKFRSRMKSAWRPESAASPRMKLTVVRSVYFFLARLLLLLFSLMLLFFSARTREKSSQSEVRFVPHQEK